jgi:acyl-CoA thioesterase
MKKKSIPEEIVQKMIARDMFSQWLGIKVIRVTEGFCELSMPITKNMLNGFGIAHGGIAFSLADSALAFASNSRNNKSLVLDANMTFTKPVKESDVLTAVAEEVNVTRRTGIYNVTVKNQNNSLVAVFKGVVFRKDELWFPKGE